MRDTVTVIGSDTVAVQSAHRVAEGDYADVVLVSSEEDWELASGSTAVILTECDDRAAMEIADRAPDAVVIVACRPQETMCRLVLDSSRFARQRVVGLGTIAASGSFRALVAEAAGVSMRDVTGLVLGGENDALVPIRSSATAAGLPVGHMLDGDVTARIEPDQPGATAAAGAEIAESVVLDRRRLLPCTTLCQGHYGIDGFASVPVTIGRGGIRRIVELELRDHELEALRRAAGAAARA